LRSSRTLLGIGAVAALILTLTTSWLSTPAGAQTAALPDAHYCELSGTSPFNNPRGVIGATGTVRCYTDDLLGSPAGQAESIGIKIDLYLDILGDGDGTLVATKDVPTSPPSNERVVGLTPYGLADEPVGANICQTNLYYTKVTGTVVYKSGMPRQISRTTQTPARPLSHCEAQAPGPVIEVPPMPPMPPRPPRPPACSFPPCELPQPE